MAGYPKMFGIEPLLDPFSPEGIQAAAAKLQPTSITIQQEKKTLIPEDVLRQLNERKLESYRQQEQGIRDFEESIKQRSGAPAVDPLVAITSGLSDMFAGTNKLDSLTQQKLMAQKQLEADQARLQGMRKDLTKSDIDMLEAQFQHQSDAEKMAAQMKMLGMKLANEKDKPEPDLKEWQVQSGVYGKRLNQAEDVFKDLEDKGYNRADWFEGAKDKLSGVWGVGHFTSDDLKRQQQAERNFVTATLRKESGASISKGEFETAEKQYFPREGDSPEVIAQKRANRQQVIEGMKLGSGRAWEQLPQVASEKGKGAKTKMSFEEWKKAKGHK